MESYKRLASYILATVIFDLTVEFCRRWIDPRSRTTDQMTQAARSGKQNIAEGASIQSLESYIKLLGVTEGSQRELAADYEDFLRQRKLSIWDKDDSRVRRVREFRAVWASTNQPNTPNLPNSPEVAANTLLTFCQMETFLLKRQIESLKDKFIREGGFRENLFKKRREYQKQTGV